MWLEEMAWVWLPIICALGAWMVWRTVGLRGEVHALSKRVARLEAALHVGPIVEMVPKSCGFFADPVA